MSTTTQTEIEEGERICWKCGATYAADHDVCPADGSRLLMLDPGDLEDPLVGELFDGRFRVFKKLGEGGMGNVYSAHQTDFEREVALKILKADFLRDENIRKRFMYEARAISNLRHPHALRLFDFGQAPDGSFYMVMELLEGESLADRLAYQFVRFRDVFNIVPPVCGVLHEAHQNKVIHRDLKPENIYLVEVNEREEFTKLLDFGIAKHLQDRGMTRSGTLWGTPAYMSPEQAKGEKIGPPADIYAIGVMLFELISGNLPFHSETQMGLAMKHINIQARPLRSIPGLGSVVPEPLDELVLQCLAKDPSDRPADASEVAQRLEQIERECFDDALLEIKPAEEVDAIALRDWIAAEPDVSDDASMPVVAEPRSIRTPTAPQTPPVSPSPASSHPVSRSATPASPVPAGATTPEPAFAGPDVSSEELRAAGGGVNRAGIAIAVTAVVAVAVVVSAILSEDPAPEPERGVAEEKPVAPVVSNADDAAGTAGVAAASAASVVMTARVVTEAVDSSDQLAADIAAEPQNETSEEPTKEDLDDVKPAVERTF